MMPSVYLLKAKHKRIHATDARKAYTVKYSILHFTDSQSKKDAIWDFCP